ncbi:DUF4179 domain-containing protein [Romboutsia sp.]|uniref:DUF4179 domain-containing protein n=1 Tax=Romboutsia sp. TaxID=1965302 RepID=UPI003F419E65
MSRIDKLVDKKYCDNLLDNEAPLSKDEKSRILQMTMDKMPTNNMKKYKKKKLLVGILVATMMLSTVVMANEYFELNLDNKLLSYLNIDKNNESLNGAGSYINKSVSENNLKLNVKQTLGDKHSLYILIDVEAPKDMIIPKYATFNEMDVNLRKSSSSGWGLLDIEDENPKDNKKSYIISFSTEGKLKRNDISIDFENFGYYKEDGEFITLVEGSWKISWKLDYTDVSKEVVLNKFVTTKKNKYFITTVNISPISVSANIIGQNNGDFMIQEVTLKDGTIYKEQDFISSGASSSFLKAFSNVEFSKAVDVNEVDSITIDDKVIKLNN